MFTVVTLGELNLKNMHMIPVTFAIILVLALVLAVAGQMNLIVNAQSDDAVVVIQPSIGGTTEPATGTHTYPSGTVITLRAIPDEGYTFQYWMVSGNVTPGHAQRSNQPPSIVDPETGEVEPPYFSQTPTVTPIDSLVFTTNPVNINCGYGYTYNYQAVFAQTSGAPSTSSPTSGFTPSGTMVISPSPTIPELPTIACLTVIIALTVACIIAIKIRKL